MKKNRPAIRHERAPERQRGERVHIAARGCLQHRAIAPQERRQCSARRSDEDAIVKRLKVANVDQSCNSSTGSRAANTRGGPVDLRSAKQVSLKRTGTKPDASLVAAYQPIKFLMRRLWCLYDSCFRIIQKGDILFTLLTQ